LGSPECAAGFLPRKCHGGPDEAARSQRPESRPLRNPRAGGAFPSRSASSRQNAAGS
jgi:hypothetical protein